MSSEKGFGMAMVIGIVALIAIIGGVVYVSSDSKVENDGVMEDESMMEEQHDDAMTDDSMMEDGGVVEASVGTYEEYSPEKLASADGKVVLFFHASWCPTCRSLNSNIEKNIKDIPEGVTILKTDYDKEIALRQKYGVTYQHTLVQVDAEGNKIASWGGSPNLSSVVSKIQ